MKFYRDACKVAFASLVFAQVAVATDYDFETARRIWEQKKSETSAATQRANLRTEQLNAAQTVLRTAQADINRLEGQLSTTNNAVNQRKEQLTEAQTSLSQLERDLRRSEADSVRLHSDLDSAEADVRRFEEELRRIDTSIAQTQRRIRELEDRNNEEDAPQIRLLRSQLRDLEIQRSQKQQSLSEAEHRRGRFQRSLSENETEIRNTESRIRGQQADIGRLGREVSDLEWRLQTLSGELSRARDRESQARVSLSQASRDLEYARENLRLSQDQELAAKLYYEEVLANYNNAVAAAREQGRRQALSHVRKEADERSATLAVTAGQAGGRSAGLDAGHEDAIKTATARGYAFGRRSGSSEASLRESFQHGTAQGQQLALEKAQAENFPAGYNERMANILQGKPTNLLEIDITEQLPDAPEDSSTTLLLAELKNIGQEAVPRFSSPREPQYATPTPERPEFETPATDRRYYAPDCDGHDLREFDQQCRATYHQIYVQDFAAQYRTVYTEHYRRGFITAVEDAYRAAREEQRPAHFQQAAQLGASHQGVLDGFANAFEQAQAQQELAGAKAFEDYLATGFLPILGDITLIEEHADGNLSPGEAVKLQITIHNYGRMISEQELLQVRLSEVNGVELNVKLRKLPSLPADTTLVLQGVLSGELRKIVEDSAALQVVARLELDRGTQDPQVIDQASFQGEMRQPFSLTSLNFGAEVRLGENSSATLVIANRTERATEPTTAKLTSHSEGIALESGDVEIPVINAGSTAAISFGYVPSVSVGGNQQVRLTLEAEQLAGSDVKLSVSNTISVERNGSLQLCLRTCNEPFESVRARAGAQVYFPIRFAFQSEQGERGPFVIRKTGASDNRIRPANNSTYSVNLGSWNQNRTPYTGQFGYIFPRDLSGTTQWVQVSLFEGDTEIHRLRIPTSVE